MEAHKCAPENDCFLCTLCAVLWFLAATHRDPDVITHEQAIHITFRGAVPPKINPKAAEIATRFDPVKRLRTALAASPKFNPPHRDEMMLTGQMKKDFAFLISQDVEKHPEFALAVDALRDMHSMIGGLTLLRRMRNVLSIVQTYKWPTEVCWTLWRALREGPALDALQEVLNDRLAQFAMDQLHLCVEGKFLLLQFINSSMPGIDDLTWPGQMITEVSNQCDVPICKYDRERIAGWLATAMVMIIWKKDANVLCVKPLMFRPDDVESNDDDTSAPLSATATPVLGKHRREREQQRESDAKIRCV